MDKCPRLHPPDSAARLRKFLADVLGEDRRRRPRTHCEGSARRHRRQGRHQLARHVRQSAAGRQHPPKILPRLIDAAQAVSTATLSSGSPGRSKASRCRIDAGVQKSLGRAGEARRRQGRAHRVRKLRHGRLVARRAVEHRPLAHRLGDDVQRDPQSDALGLEWEPCHQMVQLDRSAAAAAQVGARRSSTCTARTRRWRGMSCASTASAAASLRVAPHAGLRRYQLDRRDQHPAAWAGSRAASTSKAGTTRSIKAIWK